MAVIVVERGTPVSGVPGVRLIQVGRRDVYPAVIEAALEGEVVVGVYNGAYSEVETVRKYITAEGGNPLLYHPLGTASLQGLSPSEARALASLLARGIEACKPWRAATRYRLDKPATRRALLRRPWASAIEYVPAPIVDVQTCRRARKCRLCHEACRYNALRGKPPRVAPESCRGCGDCVRACPTRALMIPGWCTRLLETLSEFMDGLSIVFTAHGSTDGLDDAVASLPGPGLALTAVDPGWLSEGMLLAALSLGLRPYVYSSILDRLPWGTRRLVEEGVVGVAGDVVSEPKGLVGFIETVEPLGGTVSVDEARCTLCGACVEACPTGALEIVEGDSYTLVFHAGDCAGCGLCSSVCPEEALSVSRGVPRGTGSRVLKSTSIARCMVCGAPLGPSERLARIETIVRARGVDTGYLWLCPSCRLRRAYRV